MKFYYPIISTAINQCRLAKRLSVKIEKKDHFEYILSYLQKNGYIKYFYNPQDNLYEVFPKYLQHGIPALTSFRVVTKPSNRAFVGLRELRSLVFNHRPSMIHYIISTRRGFMTVQEAYRLRIGGEIMYEIW